MKRRSVLTGMAAMLAAMGGEGQTGTGTGAVFELRVYHANDGKMEALLSRFRDHTAAIFARHGITSIGYWTPTDEPLAGKTLIYLLKYPSRDEAKLRWKTFQDDPEWVTVKTASEVDGKLTSKIDSTFLTLADFGPRL